MNRRTFFGSLAGLFAAPFVKFKGKPKKSTPMVWKGRKLETWADCLKVASRVESREEARSFLRYWIGSGARECCVMMSIQERLPDYASNDVFWEGSGGPDDHLVRWPALTMEQAMRVYGWYEFA